MLITEWRLEKNWNKCPHHMFKARPFNWYHFGPLLVIDGQSLQYKFWLYTIWHMVRPSRRPAPHQLPGLDTYTSVSVYMPVSIHRTSVYAPVSICISICASLHICTVSVCGSVPLSHMCQCLSVDICICASAYWSVCNLNLHLKLYSFSCFLSVGVPEVQYTVYTFKFTCVQYTCLCII